MDVLPREPGREPQLRPGTGERSAVSKVFFKLWNTYAMFCNYAIGDGFEPAAALVPVAERQDVDRWLLGKLESLVAWEKVEGHDLRVQRDLFRYSVMSFALDVEAFIENDLSNWYVRRNKDRLQSKTTDLSPERLKDKWAAYQTLYTTLKTLCRLMAPCVPFITEVMWQNLRQPDDDPESVHLCVFPQMGEFLSNEDRKALNHTVLQMEYIRTVISLGLAARQKAKINVRQPLAELVIWATAEFDRSAILRFKGLILDELNVKSLRFQDFAKGRLLTPKVQLGKSAKAKLGPKLKEAEGAIAKMDAHEFYARAKMAEGVEVVGVRLAPEDVNLEHDAPAGWEGATDIATEVAINTTITDELKLEGLARDVVRQVQNARKDAKLDLLDQIALHLKADAPELARAIDSHRDTIATAVQATQWSDTTLTGDAVHTATAKIDGQPLAIMLRKV